MLHAAILNTAFTDLSNAACKDEPGGPFTIGRMHDSMARLYEAAKQIKEVEGQTALANLLGKTPQVVNNWEARGISAEGALATQAKIGCNANWVLSGTGNMLLGTWPFRRVALDRVMALSETDRAYVEGRLEQAIEQCELLTMSDAEQRRFEELTKPIGKKAKSVKKAA